MNTQNNRPDIDDGEEIERDIDPEFAGDEDDEAFEAKLLEMLNAADEGDDKVFSGPIEEKEIATVALEDGIDLVNKVANERGAKRRTEILGKDDDTAAQGEDRQAATDATQTPAEAASAAPEPSDLDTLLEGLDDDRRGKIAARVKDADEVMSLFRGREAQLEKHGVTAHQAMARLIQLNEYAASNPVEYIAWATANLAPEKAEEVLMQAAEKLGFKVTPADDDPFEDEETKRLRRENRALKGYNLDFGPDAEAARQQAAQNDPARVIQDFATEAGPDGKPLRPLWEQLKANIATKAKAQFEATKKPVTRDDLTRFYTDAENEMRAALGVAPVASAQPAATPAAQPARPVAGGEAKKAAPSASVERAKAASKTIDGTGQGASRRPAPSADASLEDVLLHFYAGSQN